MSASVCYSVTKNKQKIDKKVCIVSYTLQRLCVVMFLFCIVCYCVQKT